MKKYLIKGLLALVVGGFTASCADKDGDYVPVGQQKATAYADAFKELIGGEVAPNHDWGFTKTSLIDETAETRAKTRDVDVNGNMWDSRPELGATEERDVLSYMDMTLAEMDAQTPRHIYSKNFPVNMPNFFVTQVHTGDDYYGSAQDPNNKNVLGSSHMNELVIAITESAARTNNTIASNTLPEANSWHHVNNFNAGSSKDWGGNTKFVNMGTCDFAYHNSKDSRFHNRWIVVNGADIDAKYAGYYYVCFDFQSQVPDGQTDKTYFSFNGLNDSGTMQSYNGEIEGFYQTAQDILDAGITQIRGYDGKVRNIEDIEDFTVTRYEHAHAIIPGDNNYSDWIIRLCAATPDGGGSSSTSSTTRTDRVERRRLVAQGRIFCEDLGTTTVTTSDIDFNDAVFDAKIWRLGQFDVTYKDGNSTETPYLENIYPNGLENGKFKYVAEICLLAAGGTVPLKIGGNNGFEIHSKFGQGQNPSRTIGHTTIINTMGQPSQAQFTTTVSTDVCKAVTEEVDITSYVDSVFVNYPNNPEIGLDIIPIDVQWVSADHESVGELSADFGKVPQKLCVPIGTRWVYERIPITPPSEGGLGAYIDFASYARTGSPLFWNGSQNESLLYPSDPEGLIAETNVTNNVNKNPYYDRVVTEGQTVTETITETILWEGELAFAENTNGSDFTPSTLSFNEGDYIRIYGSTTNSSNNRVQIAFVDNTTNGWLTKKPYDQTNVNFTNGYVEGTLDATDISNLAGVTKFGVWGINVTITKISKVVKTRTTN